MSTAKDNAKDDFDTEEFPLLETEKKSSSSDERDIQLVAMTKIADAVRGEATIGTIKHFERWQNGISATYAYNGEILNGEKHGRGMIMRDEKAITENDACIFTFEKNNLVPNSDAMITRPSIDATFVGKLISENKDSTGDYYYAHNLNGHIVSNKAKFTFTGECTAGFEFIKGVLKFSFAEFELVRIPNRIINGKFAPKYTKFIYKDLHNNLCFYVIDDSEKMFYVYRGVVYCKDMFKILTFINTSSIGDMYSTVWKPEKLDLTQMYHSSYVLHQNFSEEELARMARSSE